MSNSLYLNRITLGDCTDHLSRLEDDSIGLLLSDIPYGINLDEWDVLHDNKNSALLGMSPAQKDKAAFKKRGKPINGWSQSDRNNGKEYQQWCESWAAQVYPKLQTGASVLIFGARRTIHRAINAFEDSGFLMKDMLAWKKPSAHHRAQRISGILKKRGLAYESKNEDAWRLGNLAPIWEPIAWMVKPYAIGGTVTDNFLKNGLGAINTDLKSTYDVDNTTLLDFQFSRNEKRIHEAQKPVKLMKYLIELTTNRHHIVLDPFMGSGTTALSAIQLGRQFIGFEKDGCAYAQAQNRIHNNQHHTA